MRISDWSSDVCSSDLLSQHRGNLDGGERRIRLAAFPLLLVEAEEIGVGELDSAHVTGRFPAARNWLPGMATSARAAFRAIAGTDTCHNFFPTNPNLPRHGQRPTYERPDAMPRSRRHRPCPHHASPGRSAEHTSTLQ